jgi:tetratricopeptide (TPR) repeat protein
MDLFNKIRVAPTLELVNLITRLFEERQFDKVVSLYDEFFFSNYSIFGKKEIKIEEYLNVKFYVGVSNFHLKNYNTCYLDLTYIVENIENIELEVNKIRDAYFYICCCIIKSSYLFLKLSYMKIREIFNRGISLNPQSVVLYYIYLQRVYLILDKKFVNKYLNLMSQKMEKDKTNSHYYYKIRGDIYFKLLDYEKALKDYLKVVKLISHIKDLPNFICVFSKNFRINVLNTDKIPFLYQKICFCCLEKPTTDFELFKKYYTLLQQFSNKEFVITMLLESLKNSYIKKLKKKIFQKKNLEKW